MSWVHIPAVILRQVLPFFDSIYLSVKWEFCCLKLWCPIIVRVIEMQYFSDGLYCLYSHKGAGSAKRKTSGPGAVKKEDEGMIPRDRSADAAALVLTCCCTLEGTEAGLDLLKRCQLTKGCCFCPGCSSGIHFHSSKSVCQQRSHIGSQGLSLSSASSVPFSA